MTPGWGAALREAVVAVIDALLGWSLAWSRDATLLLLVSLTLALTLSMRRWCTDQERLRRCQRDQERLRVLRREARQAGDQAALDRLAQTALAVRWILLRADLRVLLAVCVPVASLAVWAADRIAYHPVRLGESVELRLSTTSASLERLAHLVPDECLSADSKWIAWVVSDPDDATLGRVDWQFRLDHAPSEQPMLLAVRHAGETVQHPIRVGDGLYERPTRRHPGPSILETTLMLQEYRPLGVTPGWPAVGLAPWVVGYLIGCLGLTPLMKRLFRVA